MGELETLLRRTAPLRREYLPFSEPRWRGVFPFGPAKRDLFRISNLSPFYKSLILSKLSLPARQSVLSLYQDRRVWHPEGASRPAVSVVSNRPRMLDLPPDMAPRYPPNWERVMTPPRRVQWEQAVLPKWKMAPGRIAFEDPEKVVICLERKMRKEVLHALGIAGGPAGSRIHNWNAYSRVKCW